MSLQLAPARYQPALPEIGAERVASIVELLPAYIELAERISNTEFVPTALRRRPEAVLAALLSGAERGLGPMESLRSVHVIEGRPSLSAEAMRALVLARGHDIEIVESSVQRATVVGRRAGSTATSPEFTWTMDRARRARLASKDNWVKYPEAMLLARASADLCRAVFPDVIAGLAAVEEVADELAPEPATTSRRAPAGRGERRLPATSDAAPALGTPVAASPSRESARSADDAATPAADGAEEALVSGGARRLPETEAELLEAPPTWSRGEPRAEPEREPHDPHLATRIHIELARACPAAPAAVRDRWRHALCAIITRKRPDGPVASSSDLDLLEQLALSDLIAKIAGGQAWIADGPDDTVEVRAGGGWRYTITLDPLRVTVFQGEPAGAGAGTADQASAPAPAPDLDAGAGTPPPVVVVGADGPPAPAPRLDLDPEEPTP